MEEENAGPKLPMYWDIISESDKISYIGMRQALSSSACKHRRHHSNEINQEVISTIHAFVMRGDGDDWKRALVCGIVWLNGAIAINTRQLRLLMSKCKSSINAMFQNIGYSTIQNATDYMGALATFFPIIKDNFAEIRKWTIRFNRNSGLILPSRKEKTDTVFDKPVSGVLPALLEIPQTLRDDKQIPNNQTKP